MTLRETQKVTRRILKTQEEQFTVLLAPHRGHAVNYSHSMIQHLFLGVLPVVELKMEGLS